jgi:hypothetical protein
VDKDGTLRAAGDGRTLVTASVGGRTAAVEVTVVGGSGEPVFSFVNDVQPVLTRLGCNSGACHGALAGKGGLKLSLRGYDPQADHFVLTRQARGRRVDRFHPEDSLLLLKPTATVKHGGGMRLLGDSIEYRILAGWVRQGAPGPVAGEPIVQRIELLPAAITAEPGRKYRLLVRAVYSDGRVRDVTRWSKFSSNEELTAAVDADGVVSVNGRGEAALSAIYETRVAGIRLASPQSQPVPPAVFAGAPRRNFIDEHVLRKLEQLRIPPSPPCDDYEFVRRAFLDTIGTLPTPTEVRAFAADQAPDKRDKLIESLLSRPEYVDYWSYKWSDLLLVSSRLSSPSMWSFHSWIRKSVADNKPWDKFAREVLTASGGTLDNGAAGYFVLHKPLTELTETTSVTFMGMSITCARCHNHPLEKWTQTQYYGLANLFARVRMKTGERTGEIIVYTAPEGDTAHPRTGLPVPPQPLDGPAADPNSRADRREFFADWLVKPGNPFFARAFVNRVWRNFLGRGIFEAEDDLRAGNPPVNEELLAALAADFEKNGYDVKRLIRTITGSATYRQSSRPQPGNEQDDRFFSRYLVRRLSAEVILDAYSQIAGVPTAFQEDGRNRNTTNTPMYPLGTRALQLPDVKIASQFLDNFGRPERAQACSCERTDDSSVTQALHLSNGKTLNDKLKSPQSRVEQWLKAGITDEAAIEETFLMCLSRPPTAAEKTRFAAAMAEAMRDAPTDEAGRRAARRAALEDLVWSTATSREFLFNR